MRIKPAGGGPLVLSGSVATRVLRNDSLAIRTLRSRLDDASSLWQMPGTSITAVAVAESADVAAATSKDGGVGLYLLGSGMSIGFKHFITSCAARGLWQFRNGSAGCCRL